MSDETNNQRDPVADLAICNAATPGPWQTAAMNVVNGAYVYGPQPPVTPEVPGLMRAVPPIVLCREDAELVAISREALPYWIAEAKRLRAIVPFTSSEMVFADGREPTTNERHLFNLLTWREHEARELKREVERLRAEANALDRLRAWQKGGVGRHYSLDGDHISRIDRLDLGELSADPYEPGRMVIVDSDDEPHTEDNPATLAEMVEAALKEWERKYPEEGKPSC